MNSSVNSNVNANIPSSLAAHLAGCVRAARRKYRKRLARCQEKCSEKAVHALRVETRRLLALLDLVEALQFPESLRKTRKIFKKRLDAFDELRDTQVQLRLLKPRWDEFPEAADLKRLLRRREKRLVNRLARCIQATRYARLNRRLKQMERHLRDAPEASASGSAAAFTVLDGVFQRVATLRRQVRRSRTDTIHRLRVAFKRFRYMSELLEPFLPGALPERFGRMKEYQDLAGDVQDLKVALARLDADVNAGEFAAAAVKRLRQDLVRQQRRKVDLFMEKIDDLSEFRPEPPTARKWMAR